MWCDENWIILAEICSFSAHNRQFFNKIGGLSLQLVKKDTHDGRAIEIKGQPTLCDLQFRKYRPKNTSFSKKSLKISFLSLVGFLLEAWGEWMVSNDVLASPAHGPLG